MDYKEVELHGRKIRYYDENHIEMEFRNKKGDWRKVKISKIRKDHPYKEISFNCNDKHHIIKLHRLVFWINNPSWNIYDSSNDNSIDHFDGNRANNKIDNLSCVTNQENCWNQTKAKGYTWSKKSQKWYAQINVNNKHLHLGSFEKEEDARDAYIKAKLEYHVIKPKSFV